MRYLFFFAMTIAAALAARADSLQLKDGTTYLGKYLGGSQTEIWFHRQGEPVPDSVPVTVVQALRFGPILGGTLSPSTRSEGQPSEPPPADHTAEDPCRVAAFSWPSLAAIRSTRSLVPNSFPVPR
jgi:hypothetical protein